MARDVITSPSAQVPSHISKDLNVNLTIGDQFKEAAYGYFRGLYCVKLPISMLYHAAQTCTYFRTLIQVQPIKSRMCHVTRIQAIHIIAIWSVSGLSHSSSGDKPDTLQIAMI